MRKTLMIIMVLVVWAGGFSFFFRDILFKNQSSGHSMTTAEKESNVRKKAEKRRELLDKMRAAMEKEGSPLVDPTATSEAKLTPVAGQQKDNELITGWITIVDPWGRQIAKLRSALAADGWLALPTRAALSGQVWRFTPDSGGGIEINGGNWREGNDVGLWRLDKSITAGVGLAAWEEKESVGWMSLESGGELQKISLSPVAVQGAFIVCGQPEAVREAGVFVQGGNVVGWSFGPWLSNVYLWQGTGVEPLKNEVTVDDFYNATFAGGREEVFARALAMNGTHANLAELQALAHGFMLEAKLLVEDTPYYLRTEEVVKQIRALIAKLVSDGQGRKVVGSFDDEVLLGIGDIQILMDLIPLITGTNGFDAAVSEIERVGGLIVERGGYDVPALNDMHVGLYQDWLQSLVTVKAVDEAIGVFSNAKAYYPDDPYIHLLGVELTLLNGNWQEAEQLLYERNYPPTFLDRYELLARRISEMKGDEGKIVINFEAGSSRIPVTASINENGLQNFMVDTGASFVTIPSSLMDELGLEIVTGGHWDQRMVSTAGGVVAASEVVLDSLEIGGWVEYNVKALVLDIPDQPGLGLLGLNYLSRFQMDLNNAEGRLSLTPR